jgi:C4-dicarboxylate-binding protein DctP
MKMTKAFMLTASIVITAMMTGFMSQAASAETIIRITLQLQKTHPLGENLMAWKEIVERESHGELTVQIFPSSQLFKDTYVAQAVGSGAVPMGTASLSSFAGDVPAVDFVYLPFMMDSAAKIKAVTDPGSPIRKIIDTAVLEATNNKILWWQSYGRTVYLSNNTPFRTPDDIKGKKIRTFGRLLGWTVEALGGAPTLMSGSRQFLAYQQGAVDGGITGITAVKSRKLYEVMDYLNLTYDSNIEFVAVMNNDFFNNLPSAHKAIIEKASLIVEKDLRQKITYLEEAALEAVKDEIEIIELSEEDRQQWREATKDVVHRFTEESGPLAKDVVDLLNKL